jgi:hypothetical protein
MTSYSDAVANEGVDPESDEGQTPALISEGLALCLRLNTAWAEAIAEGWKAEAERLTRIANRATRRYWRRQDAAE